MGNSCLLGTICHIFNLFLILFALRPQKVQKRVSTITKETPKNIRLLKSIFSLILNPSCIIRKSVLARSKSEAAKRPQLQKDNAGVMTTKTCMSIFGKHERMPNPEPVFSIGTSKDSMHPWLYKSFVNNLFSFMAFM